MDKLKPWDRPATFEEVLEDSDGIPALLMGAARVIRLDVEYLFGRLWEAAKNGLSDARDEIILRRRLF